jgi:hypothetical protein
MLEDFLETLIPNYSLGGIRLELSSHSLEHMLNLPPKEESHGCLASHTLPQLEWQSSVDIDYCHLCTPYLLNPIAMDRQL